MPLKSKVVPRLTHFLLCFQCLFVPWAASKEHKIVDCAQLISEIAVTQTRLNTKHLKWLCMGKKD